MKLDQKKVVLWCGAAAAMCVSMSASATSYLDATAAGTLVTNMTDTMNDTFTTIGMPLVSLGLGLAAAITLLAKFTKRGIQAV